MAVDSGNQIDMVEKERLLLLWGLAETYNLIGLLDLAFPFEKDNKIVAAYTQNNMMYQ